MSSRALSSNTYAVITADLVLSRHLTQRAFAQEKLSELVSALNSKLRSELASRFMITLGDEIQGMLSHPRSVPSAITLIHKFFHPTAITVGVGIGGLSTKLVPKVVEMDGPVFVNARKAVEEAKKQKVEVMIRTGIAHVDGALGSIYSLLCGIQSRWTQKQWERVNLYRDLESIELVARRAKVTKQAISADLRITLWDRVLWVESQLPGAFEFLLSKAEVPVA